MNQIKVTAGITALGAYAPEGILTNSDLEKMMDTSDEWITTRTGIKRRHVAAEDEFTSDLAFRAVEDLLARHGDDALAGVDMVIIATNTPDALFPATAALVQERFKLNAGAVIVEAVPEGFGIKSMVMGADGSGAQHLHRKAVGRCLPGGVELGDNLYMNGREVYKFAVRVMNTSTIEAVEKAGMNMADIAHFVPHQANLRIIEAARERLQLESERVIVTVDEYGNNSTASIPLAIRHGLDSGRVQVGDNLLLVSFGAGLTWASSVVTWGPH